MGLPLITPCDAAILDKLEECKNLLIEAGVREADRYSANKALGFLRKHTTMTMVKGYLVSYLVDLPWYSDERVLCEMAVIRMTPTGSIKDVINYFEREAIELGCDRIVTGTLLATNDQVLARLYQRHGFSVSAWQLSKEIS